MVAEPGHGKDHEGDIDLAQGVDQPQAGHSRHLHVGDQQYEWIPPLDGLDYQGERFLSAFGDDHPVFLATQNNAGGKKEIRVVIDEKDALFPPHPPPPTRFNRSPPHGLLSYKNDAIAGKPLLSHNQHVERYRSMGGTPVSCDIYCEDWAGRE